MKINNKLEKVSKKLFFKMPSSDVLVVNIKKSTIGS